jgi:GDP-L-fucose synthase
MIVKKMFGKILVTGGTGMIGKALQKMVNSSQRYIFVGSSAADLTDLESTRKLFKNIKPEAVINLAGVEGGLYFNISNNAMMLDLNTRIVLNITRCCVEFNVQKVIMVNSVYSFPASPPYYPMDERDIHYGPVHPMKEGYGTSKRVEEIISRLYTKTTDTNFVSVYLCNVYGMYDNYNIESCHVLSSLICKAHKAVKEKTDMIVCGNGKALRQFIFVDDVAKLLLMILEQYEGSGIILSNTNDEISVNHLAEKIHNIAGVQGKILNDVSYADGPDKMTVTNKLLRTTFPLFNFTSLDEGIRITYDWYKQNYE